MKLNRNGSLIIPLAVTSIPLAATGLKPGVNENQILRLGPKPRRISASRYDPTLAYLVTTILTEFVTGH
jgi:hypothetical protein